MRVLFASNYPHLPAITGGLQAHHTRSVRPSRRWALKRLCSAARCKLPNPGSARAFAQDEHLGYLVLRANNPEQVLPLAAAAWNASVVVVQNGTALLPMVRSNTESGKPTAVYLHNVETHQLAGNLPAHESLLYLANSAFTAHNWNALYGLDLRRDPAGHSTRPLPCEPDRHQGAVRQSEPHQGRGDHV